MKFAPVPENDFHDYINSYYEECRYRFDRIEAIAGKWMFRDLMPGMSDFDTRFIVRDGMSSDDWCSMSEAVGRAHLYLCRKHPCWSRNLEHLPGINLTWEEFSSEKMYYPEYKQWSFYRSEDPVKLAFSREKISERKWDVKDEYFHLKKFCLYFGRYDRAIDPAVNLGVHENKYPLHSRVMHYFNPPVMSAVCLLSRRSFAGKFEAFETAAEMFPGLKCWDMINEALGIDYRKAEFYKEKYLVELEDEMESALRVIARSLAGTLTIAPESAGSDVEKWKECLKDVFVDPALVVFENAKFSRLMKGRLIFYADAPDYFKTDWLIGNELKRMGNNFFKVPFRTYWHIKTNEKVEDPASIVPELAGNVLTEEEAGAALEFARLTPGSWEKGTEKKIAMEIARIFDDFFRALDKLSKNL